MVVNSSWAPTAFKIMGLCSKVLGDYCTCLWPHRFTEGMIQQKRAAKDEAPLVSEDARSPLLQTLFGKPNSTVELPIS